MPFHGTKGQVFVVVVIQRAKSVLSQCFMAGKKHDKNNKVHDRYNAN